MKKLLLVALLTMPMVVLPSLYGVGGGKPKQSVRRQVEPTTVPAAPAPTAPAPSASNMAQLAQELVNKPNGVANFVAAYVDANGLGGGNAVAGKDDLVTFNSL